MARRAQLRHGAVATAANGAGTVGDPTALIRLPSSTTSPPNEFTLIERETTALLSFVAVELAWPTAQPLAELERLFTAGAEG